MEADRMGWLLPALTDARFETQRGVVLNERRQSYENRPYGLAQFALHAGAVSARPSVLAGRRLARPADLHAATRRRRARVLRALLPSRQRVARDRRRRRRRRRVRDWSRSCSARFPPGRPWRRSSPPPVRRARRARSCSRIASSCRASTWRGRRRRCSTTGDAELDLAADISRQRTHVAALPPADSRSAGRDRAGGGAVVARAGRHVSDRRDGRAGPYARRARGGDRRRDPPACRASGPTDDELERGRAQAEAAFVYRLQSLGGFGGKADQLNAYNIYRGAPDCFDADLARYLSATPRRSGGASARGSIPRARWR